MKEGIHPNYQQTTIKCAVERSLKQALTKKDIRLKSAPSVTPFSQVSRSWSIPAAVLINSTRSLVSQTKVFRLVMPALLQRGHLPFIGFFPALI